MQRRRFLQGTVLLPVWLAAVARGQEPTTEAATPGLRDRRTLALAKAWEDARAAGRPLLVLVLPHDAPTDSVSTSAYQGGELGLRGLAWGQVLHLAEDLVLAELSLCVLACATLAEARATLPEECGLRELETESPLAVLVESDFGGAKAVEFRLEPISGMAVEDWIAVPREVETPFGRRVAARVAAIGAALHRVIAPDAATLARRVAQAGSATNEPMELVPSDGSPEVLRALIARAPAVVLAAALVPPTRPELIERMASSMRETTLATAPAGARWGEHDGCGSNVRGLELHTFACGIGFVPEQDRWFLHFYTRS